MQLYSKGALKSERLKSQPPNGLNRLMFFFIILYYIPIVNRCRCLLYYFYVLRILSNTVYFIKKIHALACFPVSVYIFQNNFTNLFHKKFRVCVWYTREKATR